MRILITGGAGFIGSHLCEKYAKEGHVVVCLDNFMSGNLTNVRHLLDYRNFKLIKGDIRDIELLEKLMRDVEVVFHLAAQIHVDRSYVEPKLTWDVNVMGTQNVLDVARISDVKRVIYASSSEVYGSARSVPMSESHPLLAPHPYGASKTAADRMCFAYIQTYGMNISILRLFNTFGPRQRDIGYGGVISIFTRRTLSNMPPIVYGDGLQTRDYIYVSDAVAAYDAVLRHQEPITEPVNFGSGREVSIVGLANMIVDFCGKKGSVKPVHVDARIGEVNRLIADATKARQLLGWEAQYKIEDGLREFVEWYRNYGLEQRVKID